MASDRVSGTTLVHPITEHPIPLDQDEIDELWERLNDPDKGDPPGVDEAHEEYTRTVAEYGEWSVFRTSYPFPSGGVVFWNGSYGEGFTLPDEEGGWHHLVNLFAEIVDEEGDCRGADHSNGLMPSSATKQQCKNCGDWWMVG